MLRYVDFFHVSCRETPCTGCSEPWWVVGFCPYLGKMIPSLLRLGFAEDVNNLIELGNDEKELFPEHLSRPHHFFVVIRLFLHQIPQVGVNGLENSMA